MPSLFTDESELLRCYIAIRRGTQGGVNGMQAISIEGLQAGYNMLEASRWIEPRTFAKIMFELDNAVLAHYSKSTKR